MKELEKRKERSLNRKMGRKSSYRSCAFMTRHRREINDIQRLFALSRK